MSKIQICVSLKQRNPSVLQTELMMRLTECISTQKGNKCDENCGVLHCQEDMSVSSVGAILIFIFHSSSNLRSSIIRCPMSSWSESPEDDGTRDVAWCHWRKLLVRLSVWRMWHSTLMLWLCLRWLMTGIWLHAFNACPTHAKSQANFGFKWPSRSHLSS